MTYYIDPYGCVKNQVDAELMMAFLDEAGWAKAEDAEYADLIIINSCGFIESAKQESINAVLSWKKHYPGKKILLAGCLSQRYSKDLAETLPEADGFFGVENISGITAAAQEVMGLAHDVGKSEKLPNGKNAASASQKTVGRGNVGSRPLLSMPGSAYVKISEGCDNCCSFCAIPLIRGGLKSRDIPEIITECKTLLNRGIKEICLVGQDNGSYGKDLPSASLPGLLEALSRLDGDFWVRILYIHPDHFPLPILDIMEKDKRFLPYFDIPFQHASEKILKAMGRKNDAAFYLGLIKTIRQKLPDSVVRSTFLTGFPGETDEDFEQLLDFQKKAALDWLGCFVYSREEGTPSWGMVGRVPKKIAAKRKQLVEESQVLITENAMNRFVKRAFNVLVEEKFDSLGKFPTEKLPNEVLSNGKYTEKHPQISQSQALQPIEDNSEETEKEAFLYLGRLPCQAPEVDGAAVIFSYKPLQLGQMISCRVVARAGFDLEVWPEFEL